MIEISTIKKDFINAIHSTYVGEDIRLDLDGSSIARLPQELPKELPTNENPDKLLSINSDIMLNILLEYSHHIFKDTMKSSDLRITKGDLEIVVPFYSDKETVIGRRVLEGSVNVVKGYAPHKNKWVYHDVSTRAHLSDTTEFTLDESDSPVHTTLLSYESRIREYLDVTVDRLKEIRYLKLGGETAGENYLIESSLSDKVTLIEHFPYSKTMQESITKFLKGIMDKLIIGITFKYLTVEELQRELFTLRYRYDSSLMTYDNFIKTIKIRHIERTLDQIEQLYSTYDRENKSFLTQVYDIHAISDALVKTMAGSPFRIDESRIGYDISNNVTIINIPTDRTIRNMNKLIKGTRNIPDWISMSDKKEAMFSGGENDEVFILSYYSTDYNVSDINVTLCNNSSITVKPQHTTKGKSRLVIRDVSGKCINEIYEDDFTKHSIYHDGQAVSELLVRIRSVTDIRMDMLSNGKVDVKRVNLNSGGRNNAVTITEVLNSKPVNEIGDYKDVEFIAFCREI